MSIASVRAALETALSAVSPAISYAWENQEFAPQVGVPYAQVTLLPATPANVEMGPGYTEQGIFQANLFYPNGSGPADAIARAELIRGAFPYAASFVSGGVTVNIIATPEIGPARPEDDRFMVPVKIRWSARIGD
jgi:hypothetical protein